ncbi:MAG: hypothetical protein ACOYS2_02445 [Patescibacteria group bacterium]
MALDPIKQIHIFTALKDPDVDMRNTVRDLINKGEMFVCEGVRYELDNLLAKCRACVIRSLLSAGISRQAIKLVFSKKRAEEMKKYYR